MTANSVLFRLLLAVVLLAPLPLGSYRLWSWSLLAVCVGALALAWAILVALGRSRAPWSGPMLWAAAIPFLLVIVWGFLQMSPLLPPDLWNPMWREAARALGLAQPTGMVTVDPALTREAIVRFVSYAAVFWLAVQLGRERSRAHEAALGFCVASVAYAVYGLAVHFSGQEVIFWFPKWAYVGDLTSTFVNRNAYGAYAGIGTVCCIGLFIHVLRPSRGRHKRSADVIETVLLRGLPYLLGALITGSALMLSHSRGAFLATAVALMALLGQMAYAGVMRARMAIVLVALIVSVGGAVVVINGEGTLSRLAEDTSTARDADRVNVYRLSAQAIADAPLTGTGYGAFLPAFRVYQDMSIPWTAIWDRAHNIYLELAMGVGVVMASAFGLGLALIAGVCVRGLVYRRRDHVYPALGLSCMVLLGVHGAVDFSPQTPAIGATFALLLGIAFAQSWNSIDHAASTAGSDTDRAEAGDTV